MKKTFSIIIIIVVILVGVSLVKNFVIKSAVVVVAEQVLGAPVKIQSMSVSFLSQSVKINGMKVFNPAGFPQGNLLDINEVEVKYDLSQVLKGNIHLYKLVLRLNEMNLIKNKEGQLNVNALKVAQQKQDPNAKIPPFSIDEAVLDLGKVHYWDYGVMPPKQMTYDINVHDKTYHGIKSAPQFAALIMMEAMTPTKIKSLVHFGVQTVDKVFGTVKDAGSLLKSFIKP